MSIKNLARKSMLMPAYHRTPVSKKGRQTRKLMRENKELIAPFKKAFRQLTSGNPDRAREFIGSYKAKSVKPLKLGLQPSPGELIMLCCVKNEIERVKVQIDYYKKLGVRIFAYIDNGSTDGTLEWLREQENVCVFTTDEYFLPIRRVTWRKQAMDILGYDRWYLVLDADEFFCYPGAPQISITKYISFLEKSGYRAAFAPLIDMYSDKALFSEGAEGSFMDEYCYFDTDTYKQVNSYQRRTILGGPRPRVFAGGDVYKYGAWELAKFPLLYATRDTISPCHSNYPYHRSRSPKKPCAYLLHYKCIPSDIPKYKKIEEERRGFDKRVAGGVTDYVVMMDAYEKNPGLTFYNDKSQRLDSSMDLLKIDIGCKRFFENLLSYYGG